jgi:hypothetical protein
MVGHTEALALAPHGQPPCIAQRKKEKEIFSGKACQDDVTV